MLMTNRVVRQGACPIVYAHPHGRWFSKSACEWRFSASILRDPRGARAVIAAEDSAHGPADITQWTNHFNSLD